MAAGISSKRFSGLLQAGKGTQLLVVALVFGTVGLGTLAFSGASPLHERFKSYRSFQPVSGGFLRQLPSSGKCGVNIRTNSATAVGNNSSTSIKQTGSSSGSVQNYTYSYNNSGGVSQVGC